MGTPGSEQERQRLARLYAGLSEGELQEFADDAASLTEAAKEVLRAELERRRLDFRLGEPVAVDSSEHVAVGRVEDVAADSTGHVSAEGLEQRKLVTIRQFRDLPDALLAKGCLDSADIESFIVDDNMVRMDWFISNLLGGIKLRVSPEDAGAAVEVLDQSIPETFDVEGVGEYQQPHCPKCRSAEISFERFDKTILYTSAFFGVPVPIPRDLWKCESCGHTWQDSPDSSD